MKELRRFLFAVMMLLALVACGNQGEDYQASSTENSSSETSISKERASSTKEVKLPWRLRGSWHQQNVATKDLSTQKPCNCSKMVRLLWAVRTVGLPMLRKSATTFTAIAWRMREFL